MFERPKGDTGNASQSKEGVERGESIRRDAPVKLRRLVALLLAVERETPTTGVKMMKGLTRPCAAFAFVGKGASSVSIELALKLTF